MSITHHTNHSNIFEYPQNQRHRSSPKLPPTPLSHSQLQTKAYKKGIKTADTILKKFPENGETLAMKGLLLNSLEKRQKEEAYDLVKCGVKNNLRSHVCWHVYGLLYRTDNEYDEAIKCYKNALRFDPENLTVLRDLAQLQIQMRDLPGFLETRQRLLELKSSNRQHWVAFSLAHHLNGNYEVAASVLDTYQTILEGEDIDYERSELLLYKVMILEEGGKLEEAIKSLNDAEATGHVKDKLSATEARGRLLLGLKRHAGAETIYRKLLEVNTENTKYHQGLLKTLSVENSGDRKNKARLLEIYRQLQENHPNSTACKRMPLDFLDCTTSDNNNNEGGGFMAAADAYVRPFLLKGVPSLFSDLKPLYADQQKAAVLGELFEKYDTVSSSSNGELPALLLLTAAAPCSNVTANGNVSSSSPDNTTSDAETKVWVKLYLAQHYNHLGNTAKALTFVENCETLAPSLVEVYSVKAEVLDKAGDYQGAAAAATKARTLDLADRYLNCLAVKALFKAGKTEQAEATAALFTRDGEQANNLFDMQATWYEVASGREYLNQGQIGKALKRYLKVESHFEDFVEDQFDFHQYCVRKGTMRAYVDMLRLEDGVRASDPIWAEAVCGAVEGYLLLDDQIKEKKKAEEEAAAAGGGGGGASSSSKRKKKQQQAAAAAATANGTTPTTASGTTGTAKSKDPDPDGELLAATEDPLGEASKLAKALMTHTPHSLSAVLAAFEVQVRRGKAGLALQALKAALKITSNSSKGEDVDPAVHVCIVKLALLVLGGGNSKKIGAVEDDVSESIKVTRNVIKEEVEKALLAGCTSITEYADNWNKTHSSASVVHKAAALEATALIYGLQSSQSKEALAAFIKTTNHSNSSGLDDCVKVHQLLENTLKSEAAATAWKEKCVAVWEWSQYFGGAKANSGSCLEKEWAALKLSDGKNTKKQ